LSISSIALSQLNFYGQRLSVAWKIYSLKKVLKCRGNSFVDIDNSKWVVKNRMQNKMLLLGNGDNDIYHCPTKDKSFCCEGPGH
jgi:hypothetical protein